MHEMLHLLPHDKDSESGSYTDSGRGPSEEGDNSLDRPNLLPPVKGNTSLYSNSVFFTRLNIPSNL